MKNSLILIEFFWLRNNRDNDTWNNDTQHNNTKFVNQHDDTVSLGVTNKLIMLSVILQNVILLIVVALFSLPSAIFQAYDLHYKPFYSCN